MKKLFIVILFIFSVLFAYGKKADSNSANVPNYSYYSGKSINDNSLIAVLPKEKIYYVNIDRLRTNHDVYIINKMIGITNNVLNSKSERQNLDSLMSLTAVSAKMEILENNLKLEKLDEETLKSIETEASKNDKILKNVSKDDILFINLDITQNSVGNGDFIMIIGD